LKTIGLTGEYDILAIHSMTISFFDLLFDVENHVPDPSGRSNWLSFSSNICYRLMPVWITVSCGAWFQEVGHRIKPPAEKRDVGCKRAQNTPMILLKMGASFFVQKWAHHLVGGGMTVVPLPQALKSLAQRGSGRMVRLVIVLYPK
jgi:hypothetical protein